MSYGKLPRFNAMAGTLLASTFASTFALPAYGQVQRPKPAAQPLPARPANLPVTRVLLYKNGVGFFEHAGTVTGNQRVTIDFTSAQLNDVLQSLTAIDLSGGHIAGAGYGSSTPLDQQLKSLPLGLGADASVEDLYQALRGAHVALVDGGRTVTGRLLDVERRQTEAPDAPGQPAGEKQYLTLVSDAGAVETIELTGKVQVRLLDATLHGDVTHYLEAFDGERSQGLRHLTLDAEGTGTRQFRVSYISEVPVWKATYRILFGSGGAGTPAAANGVETATLQGWAVVDNTVGTDWNNVQLSLIAGAPQSFIQPISQPYYARRPEIGLPEEAQLTPQTHESGDLPVSGRTSSPMVGPGGSGQAAAAGYVSGGGMLGGIGIGSGSGVAPSPAAGTARSQRKAILSQAGSTNADSVAAPAISYEDSATASLAPNTKTSAFDDYFEYKLTSPITIRKNESALVPILQTKVQAERVTLWSPSSPTALRALWLTNTSNLTLDRGSFSIVEDGRFGGEGLLEPVHPQEKRLLSYAADQAVRVATDYHHDTRRLQQVIVSQGILTEKTVEIAEEEYLVRNAAPEARTVLVEQPRRAGWQLDSEVKPVETTAGVYRFRVATAPGETVRLHIGERHTLSQRYQLASFSEEQLDLLLRTNGADNQLRQQLAPVFAAKRHLAELDAQVEGKDAAIAEIVQDQERLRANLAALKGSAEERSLVKRYTGELNAQEDRVTSLRAEQAALRGERAAAQQALQQTVQALELDQTLGS